MRLRAHGNNSGCVEAQSLGYEQPARLAPQLIEGFETTARSGFDQWSQVFVSWGRQAFSLLGIVVHHDGIGGCGGCEFKAVPHVPSVGPDLTEFVDPAARNAGSVSLAWKPDFAIVEEPERAAQQVGASELDAGPLGTDELRFREGDNLTDVLAVNLQQGRSRVWLEL